MSAIRPIARALLSVFDKTGVDAFARQLHEEFGTELISTGGTANALRDAGLPVTLVEDLTGSPEMLDGRVKTLHPRIHAALLADRDNPEHMLQLTAAGIDPIDMIVVNLYPFEETIARPDFTFAEAIEMIDIGGPCLLRAAGKNHRQVLVVESPRWYEPTLDWLRGEYGDDLTDWYARGGFGAFITTCRYDAHVSSWLSRHASEDGQPLVEHRHFVNLGPMRYGENPHQTARLLRPSDDPGGLNLTTAEVSTDEVTVPMSFNNYVDADAALGLCVELHKAFAGSQRAREQGSRKVKPQHTCVFVKHTNPCGVGLDADPAEAYRKAYLGDPNAAMGGILAVDFPVTAGFATKVMETYDRLGKPLKEAGAGHAPGGFFVEVWIAPSFEPDALAVIRGTGKRGPKKDWGKRVRLLAVGSLAAPGSAAVLRPIAGGALLQDGDTLGLHETAWNTAAGEIASDRQDDVRLAWLVCKHTKSNAITICRDGMLLGNGAGQTSRVMSCRIATWLAVENGHADALQGAVAASDAFFPFADGPRILLDAGVTTLIQPGGSKRDEDTVKLCQERSAALVLTGSRHFRH